MNTILRTFNYLNHGGNKSEAPGFSLDTVRTVDKIQSNKKYSLLSLVVRWVYSSDLRRLTFVDQYSGLPKVMKYNLQEFEKQKTDLTKNVGAVEAELANADRIIQNLENKPDKMDEVRAFQVFKDHFTPFIEQAKFKLDCLQSDLDKIKSKASKCAEYYGLTANFPPDQLLTLVFTFVESVKKHYLAIVRQEQLLKKKADYEQRMAGKLPNGQTEAAFAGGHVPKPVRPVLRPKPRDPAVHQQLGGLGQAMRSTTDKDATQIMNKPSQVARQGQDIPIIRPQPQRPSRNRPAQTKVDDKYKRKVVPVEVEGDKTEAGNLDWAGHQPGPGNNLLKSRMTRHMQAAVNESSRV